jgi:transposase
MPPIPGTESMTDKERRRHRAKVLHDMGLGLGEISRRLGVHYNTAARWLNPEFRKKALAAEARWKASERGVQMRRSWHRNAYTTNKFKFKLIQCRSQAKTMGYAPCNATEQELRAAWTGLCKICGAPEDSLTRGLYMDHCHSTGRFRGWLCCFCNSAIGAAKDDPSRLRRMAEYLET